MSLIQIFPHITGVGDSLMSGEHVTDKMDFLDNYEYAWLAYMCRRNGIKYTIKSYGGCTCESWLNSFNRETYQQIERCPCYFICLGSNDFGCCYDLGTINDDCNSKTYMSYYKTIVECIRTTNPYAYLFLCSMYSPEEDKNEKGVTRGDFNRAVKEIADHYERAYYLDFIGQGEAILGEEEITLNGHYNTIGYYKASLAFEKAANKIIEENLEDFKKVGLYHSFGYKYPGIRENF